MCPCRIHTLSKELYEINRIIPFLIILQLSFLFMKYSIFLVYSHTPPQNHPESISLACN